MIPALVLAAVVASIAIASCASQGAQGNAANPNHITVLWYRSQAEFGESDEAFDPFWSVKSQWEAEHGPGSIDIIDVGGWEQQAPRLRRLVERGFPVDLAWMREDLLMSCLQYDLLQDITPYIDVDGGGIDFETDGVYPGLSASYTFDGKVYAAGAKIEPMLLYYNEDLFRAAGIKTPAELYAEGAWTWAAFAEAARALTSDRDGQWGLGLHFDARPWVMFMGTNGARTIYPERINAKPGHYNTGTDIAEKRALDTFIFMRGLYGFNEDGSPGLPICVWEGDYLQAFRHGSIAMIAPSGNDRLHDIGGIAFNVGVAPLPAGPARAVERRSAAGYGVNPEGYCIPRTSAHPEAAAAFIRMAVKAFLDYERGVRFTPYDEVYREAARNSVYSPMQDAYGVTRFWDVNKNVFQWIRGPSPDHHPWNEGYFTLDELIISGKHIAASVFNGERLGPVNHHPLRAQLAEGNPKKF
jgi:ABC-type glycerol-3-phosphate transport system substrate-binding protein